MTTSIHQILSDHNVRFVEGGSHPHVREGWIGIDCPWCGDHGEWHLGVELTTNRATCWQCGWHRLSDVLVELLGIPFAKAWSLIRDVPSQPGVERRRQAKGELKIPKGVCHVSSAHRSYLRGRGFDVDELLGIWRLQGIGPSPRLAWRIWIPVHLNGEIVSWTTRAIGVGGPKYVNARPDEEVLAIKSLLYGWDHVRGSIVVCEGPTDAWRIGPGAVATFGVNVTADQISLLSTVPRRFVCFDNEPTARRRARRLCEELRIFPGETKLIEIDSPDPGSATDEEVSEIRKLLK